MKAIGLCTVGVWVVLGTLNYGMALRGDPHGVLRGVNCMQWAAITYLLFRRWIAPPGEQPVFYICPCCRFSADIAYCLRCRRLIDEENW